MKDFKTNNQQVNLALKQALTTFNLNESFEHVESLMLGDLAGVSHVLTPENLTELEEATDQDLTLLRELLTQLQQPTNPNNLIDARIQRLESIGEDNRTVPEAYELKILNEVQSEYDDLWDIANLIKAFASLQSLFMDYQIKVLDSEYKTLNK
jgi:hypothetical protein